MAITTTASFSTTRNQLVIDALSIIGVVEPGNTEMATGIRKLNAIVRNLDAKAQWLWAISPTESTLTTVDAQSTYATGITATTISANILELTYAAVLINTDYRDLKILDKMTSQNTTLKDDANGEPLAISLFRANTTASNTVRLYPTPNSAYTIKYNFRRPLYDFSAADENPDFPAMWFLPLTKILAYELSYDFSKPLAERQLLQAESKIAYDEVERFNADKPSYITLKTEYY